jgi:hypothetical protein
MKLDCAVGNSTLSLQNPTISVHARKTIKAAWVLMWLAANISSKYFHRQDLRFSWQ